MNNEQIKNALFGFIVGDALGVPYEFMPKEKINDVSFTSGGKHGMPIGAWSDDTSMMLCLISAYIENGLNFQVFVEKIITWATKGYMTPTGRTFGMGRSTFFSILKLKKGISYLDSGEKSENSNGNGALMRIVPLVFILQNDKNKFELIEEYCAITHAHIISKIACSIYVIYFQELIKTNDKILAYLNMQNIIKKQYEKEKHLQNFNSILEDKIYYKNIELLSGYGYVISTLEVALHCFINGKSYEDCVINAIKIGNDTDTNAALTGALAGYYYNSVPKNWIEKLIKHKEINSLLEQFMKKLESINSVF